MNWLFRNLRIFALAFTLALAVWVSAVTAADPDEVRVYPRPVPLEIVGQDPRLIIVGNLPEQVNVTLRAPRSTWEQLSNAEGQIRAVLDLSGQDAGQHSVSIQLQVRLQPVRVIAVTPAALDVFLEPLATTTFPVALAVRGEPAIGYEAGITEITPSAINISGPQSTVDRVERVTADINIAGVRQDVQNSINVRILDKDGVTVEGLTISPDAVQIRIPIVQQGGYRDIAVKVSVRGQVAGGYRLTNVSVFPPVLTVYSQNPALVNDLPGFVETQPLNLNGVNKDVDARLALVLPPGVTVVGEQTVHVQVGISAIEGSLSINNIPIEITGLPPELESHISPATVDVILTGPLPVLEKLTSNDVRFIIDLTGLSVGVHQLTPQAQIMVNDVEVQSLNPGTIEVIIRPKLTPSPTP